MNQTSQGARRNGEHFDSEFCRLDRSAFASLRWNVLLVDLRLRRSHCVTKPDRPRLSECQQRVTAFPLFSPGDPMNKFLQARNSYSLNYLYALVISAKSGFPGAY